MISDCRLLIADWILFARAARFGVRRLDAAFEGVAEFLSNHEWSCDLRIAVK